jgi:hypothetical protein
LGGTCKYHTLHMSRFRSIPFIFTTKKGELRLVLDRKKPSWFAGKAQGALINLPLEDNRMMIDTDLGVYAGQRLGTPCDDRL